MSTIYMVRSVFIVIGLVTTSCFTGDHDDADDELSLLEACHGRYRCTDVLVPEFQKSVTFSRQSDGCYVNDERVGTPGLFVDGDRDSFLMCNGSICYDCVRASGTPSKGAQCTGSASSCSSVGATFCAWQSGCHYTVGATLSTSDDGCAGTARECSDIATPDSCLDQDGCSWKP